MFSKADSRILLVDDDPGIVSALHRVLAYDGYREVRSTTEPTEVPALFQSFDPDLIVLDLAMPRCDGFAILAQLREFLPDEPVLPVLVLSGESSTEAKRRALEAGAADILNKPCDAVEFLLRIQHLLDNRSLRWQLELQNRDLESRVRERTRELHQAQEEMLQRLAVAGEARDDETGRHTQRVGLLSGRLARALGLPEEQVALIRRAAPLHDVGKIAVPDSILLKPGKLTPDEMAVMQQHTVTGARILQDGHWPLMHVAQRIARSHHERWDGSGYPDGLAGAEIPVEARIVAAVDVFDALSHDRPYRPAWPMSRVMAHLAAGRGSHFDPRVIDALESLTATGLRGGAGTVRAGDHAVDQVA